MTDNDIIKALECCSTYGVSCTNCPAYVSSEKSTCREVLKGAVEIINRQNATIEQLEKDKESFANSYAKAVARNLTIKAEAVKEFAELLKEHIRDYHPYYYVIDEEVVDNLVEEMVGENNAPCN